MAKVVESLGCPVARIHGPGTLDGGDVLKVGSTVYVGRGGRTNGEGVRQLRHALEPLGATVVAVPVTKVLHLKSAVTALPDGTVIGYPPVVDDPHAFDRFLAVPEEPGAHVVLLGGDKLLASAKRAAAPSCSPASAMTPWSSTSASTRSSEGDVPVRPPAPPGAADVTAQRRSTRLLPWPALEMTADGPPTDHRAGAAPRRVPAMADPHPALDASEQPLPDPPASRPARSVDLGQQPDGVRLQHPLQFSRCCRRS